MAPLPTELPPYETQFQNLVTKLERNGDQIQTATGKDGTFQIVEIANPQKHGRAILVETHNTTATGDTIPINGILIYHDAEAGGKLTALSAEQNVLQAHQESLKNAFTQVNTTIEKYYQDQLQKLSELIAKGKTVMKKKSPLTLLRDGRQFPISIQESNNPFNMVSNGIKVSTILPFARLMTIYDPISDFRLEETFSPDENALHLFVEVTADIIDGKVCTLIAGYFANQYGFKGDNHVDIKDRPVHAIAIIDYVLENCQSNVRDKT